MVRVVVVVEMKVAVEMLVAVKRVIVVDSSRSSAVGFCLPHERMTTNASAESAT